MKSQPWRRREFITVAGMSLPILAAGPARVLSAPAPSETKKIKLGFLGATYSHFMGKLGVVRRSPEFELIGVADKSAAGRQACQKEGVLLLTEEELLAGCEVIVVESDVRDHGRHALLALNAGKHVHVEKPPGTTLAELEQLVTAARTKKVVLQTGYMWRYHPGFEKIFEAVRQGWLGDIFLVRASIHNFLAPARRAEWDEFKGGSLFELGSHLLDAIVRLMGPPKNVTPFLRQHGKGDPLKDNNLAVLEYDRAWALLTNTALQATAQPQRSFEVLGSNGSATLRPIEPPALEIELVKPAGPYPKGMQTVSLPPYERYQADFAALAAAIRGTRPLPDALETELQVQQTLLRASEML
jgi:predicted dehydrogenase